MEEKTITLKELDAYICIASFYITRECRLNGRETSSLIDLVTDIRDRIVGHVTGKIPFDQEDLNLVYETKARLDFLRAVLETEGGVRWRREITNPLNCGARCALTAARLEAEISSVMSVCQSLL